MHGTVEDDKMNVWWKHLYDTVLVLEQLGISGVKSANAKGNVVEALLAAGFVASCDLENSGCDFPSIC